MDISKVLEKNMHHAYSELDRALLQPRDTAGAADFMREIADADIKVSLANSALFSQSRLNFDLAHAAIQEIK